jgi:RNA polymerase sigma-70 factor (ECF subfamily)
MAFSTDSMETSQLLEDVAAGDMTALERLLRIHRPYLKRVAQMRIDPALATRVDASDIVQEVQLVIAKRIDDFIRRRPTSLRIWMRRKVLEQLVDQQRRHLGAQKRSILKEEHVSNVSSLAIARKLLSNTPSKVLRKIELQERVSELIEQLGDNDREILSLRHAEGLTNVEVADLLGIEPDAARKRHGRALLRAHRLLAENNISMDEMRE